MLVRAPTRVVRNPSCFSGLWEGYRPRDGDIVIATFPRSGTTWTQRIASILIFQSPEPRPIWHTSPHIDGRPGDLIDSLFARLEAQTHRRFLKSHLPFDALPIHDEVRYIHVAREPRDAALSLFGYLSGWTAELAQATDRVGIEDPEIGHPLHAFPKTPQGFFSVWLGRGVEVGAPFMSDFYFHMERSWWLERRRANVLLVHYADLKADLDGEMRRISRFLDISVNEARWPSLVDAAGFAAMKRDGSKILPGVEGELRDGVDGFLPQGTGGRWRDVLSDEVLRQYATRLAAEVSPTLAAWLERGRKGADPRDAAD